MKIALPIFAMAESGHIVYDLDSKLLGFIRDDVMRAPLGQVLGEHILLQPIQVKVTEFHRLCRMPGVGHVDC
jgi:hypothetical protein